MDDVRLLEVVEDGEPRGRRRQKGRKAKVEVVGGRGEVLERDDGEELEKENSGLRRMVRRPEEHQASQRAVMPRCSSSSSKCVLFHIAVQRSIN